ncbi:EAL and HDOD domain-containing protein [Legionella dresdenensis]|uniref:EAL and HDOD domain-containing protein n=1 Tax=Legionella dresdenensis TaxID=450200 RepID=A0ABV8CIJ0_9GAMM
MEQTISTLIARQEIYDRSRNVCGYELLYRDGERNESHIDPDDESEGEHATSYVISHLFANLDMDMVLGSQPAFINFTRNSLLARIPLLLPRERVVIEFGDIQIDDELIEAVTVFSKRGYKIALDDFIYRDELKPLIAIANIIKIDVLHQNDQQIKKQLLCVPGDFQGKLLAERVETREQFDICKALGFHLFQGFFLNQPNLIQGHILSENKIYLLRLLAELHNPEVKMQRVEEIILQIPKLSYRILRLANSASMYMGKKIDSLMDAIQQLGLIQIRDWICLLLVSSLDDISPDLLERTLIRAKMCQLLAKKARSANPHQAYTVGMLSTLDAILNEPMPSLLAKIHLSEGLNKALLYHKGVLGTLLANAQDYERGYFTKLQYTDFTDQDYSEAYLQGIEYANEVMQILR